MSGFFVGVWLQLGSRERANPPNAYGQYSVSIITCQKLRNLEIFKSLNFSRSLLGQKTNSTQRETLKFIPSDSSPHARENHSARSAPSAVALSST